MSNTFQNNAVGKQVTELNVSPQFAGYSGVEINVDDNTTYFAGSYTGRVLSISNAWGSQEQANNILSAISGFQYQPYEASGALLNPAAEIGDAVTLNGVYSGIYKMSRNFSSLMAADIAAPQDEELDHEYPYEPKQDRVYKRTIAETQSQLRVLATEISAEVVKKQGGNTSSFGWTLTDSSWSVSANGTEVFHIDQTGATVQGAIRATSGFIGGFNIGNTALYNGMTSLNSSSSGVYLGTDGISVGGGAFKVTSSGAVSANNMTLTGTLNIGGTTITAANLRLGAAQAAANYGTWSGASSITYGGYSGWNATTSAWKAATDDGKTSTVKNMRVQYLTASVFNGYGVSWKSQTVCTYVSVNGRATVNNTGGTAVSVVTSINPTTTTIYYLGR